MTLYHVSRFLALPTSRRPLNGRLARSAVPPVVRVCLSKGTPHRFPRWSDAASGDGDHDKGHGNDADGHDEDNPGRSDPTQQPGSERDKAPGKDRN